MRKAIFTLLLTGLLTLSLTGCGAGGTEASSTPANNQEQITAAETLVFDTDAYAPPAGRGAQSQDIRHLKVSDFARPDRLIYIVDGKAKVFTPEDAKFDRILELNAARDKTDLSFSPEDETGNYSGERNMYKTSIPQDYYKSGRYLIYRYGTDGYRDLVFSLVKEEEGGACWVFEEREADADSSAIGAAGPYAAFEFSDALIACIEG